MKFFKYLFYLLKHKWFVAIECFRYGLIWRGLIHDVSKFKPSEFVAYKNYFYGDYRNEKVLKVGVKEYDDWCKKEKQKRELAFNFAWLKHQKTNKHHWQWWILEEDDGNQKILPMSKKYIKEMLCDWVGAGKARGRKSPDNDRYLEVRTWYKLRSKKIKLYKDTRVFLEKLLGIS